MGKITKDDANKIAKKLKAKIDRSGKAHDLACIEHDGIEIASFGIRRGTGEHLGHNHIAGELHMGPHDTKSMAQCSISREQWIARMQKLNLI
jgi:hypothetical protein